MRRVYPVPELVIDEMVRVDDTGEATEGSMDNNARIMRVPLLDTPACRHVRAHEMAHAKYSPKAPTVPEGTTVQIIQRMEDMRMNRLCRAQELDEAMDASIIPNAEVWRRVLPPGDDAAALTAGISCYGTGDWNEWQRRAKPSTDDIELIQSLWDEIGDEPSWEKTQELSQKIARYLEIDESHKDSSGKGESEKGEGKPMDFSGDIIDELVDEKLEADAAREAMSPFEAGLENLENQAENMSGYHSKSKADIIPAKIVTMPLTRRMAPSKFKSRAKVASDRGMVPKYMNRYCTDKSVFIGRGRKRDNGGTILIDASGSMGIRSGDIDRAMEIAPLGTIASYSGYGRDGEIRIIAKGGKRAVDSLRPEHGGNLVDVAGLEWMVKQPGPYYWVCDGVVSGADPKGNRGEIFGKNIFDRCIALVKQHGIIMVPNLDSLPEIMRKTL